MNTVKIFNDKFYVGWYKNFGGMYKNPIKATLSPFFRYWKHYWKSKILNVKKLQK